MSWRLAACALVAAGCAHRAAPHGAASPAAASDAEAGLARILQHIAQEDSPRPEREKTRTVREQIAAELAAAQRARGAELAAAVARLERAYLDSELDSTYAPVIAGPWAPGETRDQLGSPTCDAKLARWQPADRPHAFVKFAIPPGHPRVIRVGPYSARHVDIAGGPAIAAGVMRVRFEAARPVVIAIENSSSGLRPGSLRNRTMVRALREAGLLPANPDELTVHDNPTAEYERSVLAQPRR